MVTELELKLLVPPNATENLERKLLPQLTLLEKESADLYNQYFDTPDSTLKHTGIGLRIRGKNHRYEQTIKTKGNVTAGLHSRQEYNVDLPDNKLDLSRFEEFAWPENLHPNTLQNQLFPIFTTHFSRTSYLVKLGGSKIEIASDHGKISCDELSRDIHEVELELIEGSPDGIFELARMISRFIPVQLGSESKAARGYKLANKKDKEEKVARLTILPIEPEQSIEQCLIFSLQYALNHWQRHQQAYFEKNKFKHLYEIYNAMQLLAQALKFYSPFLECPLLIELNAQIKKQLKQWQDIIQLKQLKELLSLKGPYRKILDKDKSFISFLKGRYEGLFQQFAPAAKLQNETIANLTFSILNLILTKPWRDHSDKWNKPISKYSQEWLSKEWSELSSLLPIDKSLSIQGYLGCEHNLKQIMYSGVLLANLYPSPSRQSFRAAWLGILEGVEELNTLSRLHLEVEYAQLEGEKVLIEHYQSKVEHLLDVMEISRKSALKMPAYWL